MNGVPINCWVGWAYLGLWILGVLVLIWGLMDPNTEIQVEEQQIQKRFAESALVPRTLNVRHAPARCRKASPGAPKKGRPNTYVFPDPPSDSASGD